MLTRILLAMAVFAAFSTPVAAQECQRSRAPSASFAEAVAGTPTVRCVEMTGVVIGSLFVEDGLARYRRERVSADPSSSGSVLGYYGEQSFAEPTRVRIVGQLTDCTTIESEARATSAPGRVALLTGYCLHFSGRAIRAVFVEPLGPARFIRATRADAGPDLGNLSPLARGDTRTRMLAAARRFADAVRTGDRATLAAMHGGGPEGRRSPRETEAVLALLLEDSAPTPFSRLRSGTDVRIEIFGWKPPLWADEAWQRQARASGAEEAIACFTDRSEALDRVWPIDSKDADNLAGRPYACTRIRLAGQGIDAAAQFDTFQAAGGVAEPER